MYSQYSEIYKASLANGEFVIFLNVQVDTINTETLRITSPSGPTSPLRGTTRNKVSNKISRNCFPKPIDCTTNQPRSETSV